MSGYLWHDIFEWERNLWHVCQVHQSCQVPGTVLLACHRSASSLTGAGLLYCNPTRRILALVQYCAPTTAAARASSLPLCFPTAGTSPPQADGPAVLAAPPLQPSSPHSSSVRASWLLGVHLFCSGCTQDRLGPAVEVPAGSPATGCCCPEGAAVQVGPRSARCTSSSHWQPSRSA